VAEPRGGRAAARARAGRLDYGWIVVAALSVTETISWGILYYGFPVFLRAMEDHLGASRVAVTGAFAVGMGIAALAALPVGRWLDRRGPWGLMTLGSCLGTALLLAWTRVETLAGFYLLWAVMGLALAATLYEPAFGAVVAWFRTRHRDRALTIVTLAGALASTIFMPLAAWLLERRGWQGALVALAALLGLTTIPIHAVVLRRRPPAFDGRDARHAAAPPVASATLGEAARTPFFWVLTAAFVVGNFATVSVTVHLIPYLTERGWSAPAAAAVIGWIGAMQVPGRLLFAAAAARLGPRTVTTVVFLVQALALAGITLVPRVPGTLVVVIVLLGAANGMSTLSRATTIADVFGPRHYASIAGAVALGANGARAIGPVGAALLHAGLGHYDPVFWTLAAGLGLVGAALATTEARGAASARAAAPR
jgi:MFS family permease